MLSAAQKTQASALLDVAFDTFKDKTPLTIYKTPEKIIVSSDADFNYAYPNDNPMVQEAFVVASGQFEATVRYYSSLDAEKFAIVANNVKLDRAKDLIKISVRRDGRDMLLGAERIEFDGNNHILVTDERPRGLFERNYYDFWLQREN